MTEVILETPRLSLRRFTLADAPFMLGMLNDPAFIRGQGYAIEAARAVLAYGKWQPLAHRRDRLGRLPGH